MPYDRVAAFSGIILAKVIVVAVAVAVAAAAALAFVLVFFAGLSRYGRSLGIPRGEWEKRGRISSSGRERTVEMESR